jgi:hypothetical protein
MMVDEAPNESYYDVATNALFSSTLATTYVFDLTMLSSLRGLNIRIYSATLGENKSSSRLASESLTRLTNYELELLSVNLL